MARGRFRPQQWAGKYRLRCAREKMFLGEYNWYVHSKASEDVELKHRVLGKIAGHLHYLASHAPEPVRKKWWNTYKRFMNRHTGNSKRGSFRFITKYTADKWL